MLNFSGIIFRSGVKRIILPGLLLFLLGCIDTIAAQEKSPTPKADAFFNNKEYAKAIPLYENEGDKSEYALKKLADCYRLLKDYGKAGSYYEKLAARHTSDPMVYYNYGTVLLADNKFEEAKKQFSIYSVLDPDEDNKGELYANICDKAKELTEKPSLYKVYNLGDINTSVADFCPVFYKDGIIFSSEKLKDLVNFSYSSSGNPSLSLVFSKAEKKSIRSADSTRAGKDTIVYRDAKLFSNSFFGGGHYGPACFSDDFSEIYFMKVEEGGKKGQVNQPKIYCSKYKNGWNTPEMLPFCSDQYATGHPSLSKDGKYLYFTSNRPGGMGGFDIWVSKRDGDVWGAPQNLGKEINTSEDDVYPYMGPGNILYFSSKGHTGFGGLDIYASLQKVMPDAKSGGTWASASNLMPPVNSTFNDFGIVFKDDNRGFFSSNRPGGEGSDDIFGFSLSGIVTSVTGKILLSPSTADPAPNVKVLLLSSKGDVLGTTRTNPDGSFKFTNLPTDQSYMVKLDEKDPLFLTRKKLYMTDEKDRVVRVIGKNQEGSFVFENLPADLNRLSRLDEEDASIAGNLYAGDDRTPIKNATVKLVNDKGEVIERTTTNSFGSFVFMHLPSDENVTISLDDVDPSLLNKKVYFTTKSGKEIAVGEGRTFKYKLLASDNNTLSLLNVDDSQMLVDLDGKLFSDKDGRFPLAKIRVCLVDEKGNVARTYVTDESGSFKFTNLPANKRFVVRLKEDDPTASGNVYMADSRGKILTTLRANGKFFSYSVLPSEEQTLMKIYFNDSWLRTESPAPSQFQSPVLKTDQPLTIIENIYYEYHKWSISPQARITLNKVAEIMKSNSKITIDIIAHTDSRGSAGFNLGLSQRRAQAAVDYIVSKGVDKNRLTARGMGETRLVNNCSDGVECSEERHAQNRRTEFKVRKN